MIDIPNTIIPLIGKNYRVITNVLQQRLQVKNVDITPEQAMVLMKLSLEEGLSQQQFAIFFYKEKSSITRLINNMEKKNLIVRIPDKNDKRNKLLYFTPYGRTIQKQVQTTLFELLTIIKNEIASDELETCKKVLKQVFNKLSN